MRPTTYDLLALIEHFRELGYADPGSTARAVWRNATRLYRQQSRKAAA